MDIDISKSIEELEAKKRSINLDADLTRECKSIIELDNRLGLLLNQIRTFRDSVQEQSKFIDDKSDVLEPSYKGLVRTSLVFELTAQLIKLNRLCKRLDKINVFGNHQRCPSLSNIRSSQVEAIGTESPQNENDIAELADDDQQTNQILELLEQFEETYKPLEEELSRRQDLPYVSYATKARNFRAALETVQNIKH